MMTTLIPITRGIGAGRLARREQRARRSASRYRRIPQRMTSDLDLTVEENLNIYAKLYDVLQRGAKRQSTNCWKLST